MTTAFEDFGRWLGQRGTELGHTLSGTIDTDALRKARENGTYAQGFDFNDPALDQQRRQAWTNATMANAERQRQVDTRGVPLAGAVDNAQNDWRAQQMSLASTLGEAALGHGPSVAQGQFRRNTDDAMAQQMALAASSRGANPLAAINAAMQNQGSIAARAAADSGMLRMQEQLAARDQLAGVLNAGRSGDFQHAGMLQQNELANQNAQLQARGQNDAFLQHLMDQQRQNDESFYSDQWAKKLAQAQDSARVQDATINAMNKQASNSQSFFGGLLNNVGQIAAKAGGMK